MGERNEKTMPGFDFGNSPSHIIDKDFKGKTIIHTTSAGTQGLVNALNATELITGSFVNAGAIVSYIRKSKTGNISLVCMGYSTLYPTEEDTFCAQYIKNELEGKPTDFKKMVEILKKGSGKRFFDPDKQSYAPAKDFDLCTDLNRFNFIIKATWNDGLLILNKLYP